jgi:6-phosphogluconolactonase
MTDESPSSSDRSVIVQPSVEQACRTVAELFKSILCEAVDKRGTCSMALAGGTTPHALYQLLAEDPSVGELPWQSMHIFFGDERDVPQDDVESNYGMAQRTLLDHVPLPPGQVHPMPADADDLAAAAEEYEQIVRRFVPAGPDGMPRLDLVLLGMGGDGHTASLFPHSPATREERKLIVGHFVEVLGRNRMTMTYPLINAARTIVFLVTGDDKAEAVDSLIHEGEQAEEFPIPAACVRPTDGKLYFVLDSAAARLIQ